MIFQLTQTDIFKSTHNLALILRPIKKIILFVYPNK